MKTVNDVRCPTLDFKQPFVAMEDLGRHTSFKIGGPAELFFEPANRSELVRALHHCRDAALPVRILGRGTNLLVGDAGVEGAVISTAALQATVVAGNTITADCGVGLPELVTLAANRGLSGLEHLTGIPGSLGGAIKMNAGAASGCIADVVDEITVLTPDGEVSSLGRGEVDFGYRTSGLDGAVVVSATLKLSASGPERVFEAVKANWRKKAATQPIREASAGCVFRNPPCDSAGKLLDRLGLKGASEGGAKISEKHANFIINCSGATAADVMALIKRAREAVFRALGITLELEIEVW